MAAEINTRESLHQFVLSIAKDIDEGKDLTEVAESLEEATGIADQIADEES